MKKKHIALFSILGVILLLSLIRIIFFNSNNPEVNPSNVAQVLATASDEELQDALKSSDDYMKTAAIVEFSKRHPQRSAELGHHLKDKSANVRATAISSLSNANRDISNNLDDILLCLNDDDVNVRLRALGVIEYYIGIKFDFDFGPKSTRSQRSINISKIKKELSKHKEHLRKFYASE